MKSTPKGNLYIFLAAFCWSLGGLLLKYVPYSPVTANGLRCLFAFLVFWIYRRSPRIRLNRIVILAALSLTLCNILFVAANKLTTAANAIVLEYTAPIWVLLWNSLYEKRAPKRSEIFTMLLAFAGTVLFFFDGLTAEYVLGNVLSIAAGICFSGVLFLNFLPDASSEDSSMLSFLLSFLISLPFLGEVLAEPTAQPMISILVLGIVQVGVAYIFFARGTRLTAPVTASLISLLEAIMNPFWVFLFYGEKVGRFALIGAVLILIAVAAQILFSAKES